MESAMERVSEARCHDAHPCIRSSGARFKDVAELQGRGARGICCSDPVVRLRKQNSADWATAWEEDREATPPEMAWATARLSAVPEPNRKNPARAEVSEQHGRKWRRQIALPDREMAGSAL